jgi:hypothetical protein
MQKAYRMLFNKDIFNEDNLVYREEARFYPKGRIECEK